MSNPFTLSFGKKPLQYISRIVQTNQVIEEFCAKQPSNQIFMLTGVRGSGKTVMMTNLAAELRKIPDWIVVELNPTRDLLQSLAAKIYSLPEMHTRFLSAKFDFSAFGLGVSVENAAPVTDIENALELMLAEINKAGKRLLVTIDEVTNSEYIRVFASAFQIFIREEYPIFLIMTGLYENIYDLQNDKALTFLYRAPKIMLEPLNYTAIRKNYMDIFEIEITQAEKMTELTKGYPFAFQVLGYLYWEYRAEKKLEEINLSVNKIEKITGHKPNLYRAPYGEYNNIVIKTAQENGFYTIQWNLDTLDYQGLTGEEMWNRLKNKLDGGSIILSHNGTKHTADSLDMLIKNIKASGFKLITISELIYKDNYSINNNGTQVFN